MTPQDAEGWIKVVIGVLSALSGIFATWVLMRRDIADLKRDVEGGPDDWSVPEMRRRLQGLGASLDKLTEQVRQGELVDSKVGGELKALEQRVAEHAERTIQNGQEGYRQLFKETLDRQDSILRRLEGLGQARLDGVAR